jgi:hypothetical protein
MGAFAGEIAHAPVHLCAPPASSRFRRSLPGFVEMTTNTAQQRKQGLRPHGFWLMPFIACALGAICLALFFRETLASGGALLPGELGDTRFNNALLEHWVRWPGASWTWDSPPFFFPEARVLAYSDALFLFVPFYTLARLVGASPYYALAATSAALLVFGYASAIWLFRRILGLPAGISYLGAALTAFPSFLSLHYGHFQMFATLLLPALFGAALRYLSDRSRGHTGFIPGLVVAAGIPLLLFTSYYVGWFFVFFLALFAGFLAWLKVARNGAAPLRRVWSRLTWWSLASLGAVFLISLIPFLALYLPRYSELGPRLWESVAKALPRPIDLINVGPDNMVWGALIAKVVPPGRELGWELEYGLPPALFLLFGATCIALFLPGRGWLANEHTERHLDVLRALALSVVFAWVLLLYWRGHSLWFFVFKLIPGAGALRAVSRFQAVLHLAVIIVATFGLYGVWRAARSSVIAKILIVGLFALLMCEEQQRNPPMFHARAEASLIASVEPPPLFCSQFMLLPDPSHAREPMPYTANIDAMMIALRLRLPTINGYDGDTPSGWGLWDPFSSDYASAAADWASSKHVANGLCTLDFASGRWRKVAADPAGLVGKNLIDLKPGTIDEALSFSRSGFYGLDNNGRWTNGLGVVRFSSPVSATRLHVDGAWNRTGVPVRVVVNGRLKASERVPNAPFSIDVALSEPVQSIEIESAPFVPQKLGINENPRALGVLIERLVLN